MTTVCVMNGSAWCISCYMLHVTCCFTYRLISYNFQTMCQNIMEVPLVLLKHYSEKLTPGLQYVTDVQ